MPRVKQFDKDIATKKALELFWEQGYAATSLTDLTDRLGIGKGSFYDTFKSKRDLFNLCFDSYQKSNVAGLEALLHSEPDVKKGIKKLLEGNVEQLFSDNRRKGCMLANICSELGGVDQEVQTKLSDNHTMIHKTLTTYLRRQVKKPAHIADMIMTFLMGMNQEAKFKRDKKSYLNSISLILGLLG